MQCRHCGTPLSHKILDLGHAPASNAYLDDTQRRKPETHFPLRLYFCDTCTLVQTEDFCRADDLFTSDYVYFSSTSRSWCDHAAGFAQMAQDRLELNADSFVVEIASNDGYLLRNFVAAGIPCLGFEPTASTANVAVANGIETQMAFFTEETAKALRTETAADLIVGNNVFAHVPDINGFARGLAHLLSAEGAVSLEFPHLYELVTQGQFDTVYHEHFSYLSLTATQQIFAAAGLRIFDVERLPTHGGSLRVWGCHAAASYPRLPSVDDVLHQEQTAGLTHVAFYQNLQTQADKAANGLLRFLLDRQARGEKVAAYGAAAKGTTLLNYAGVTSRLLPFVCDAAPFKQDRWLPGCHIPVLAEQALRLSPPQHLLILPWNIQDEIAAQLDWLAKEHGTAFWTLLPEPTPLPDSQLSRVNTTRNLPNHTGRFAYAR